MKLRIVKEDSWFIIESRWMFWWQNASLNQNDWAQDNFITLEEAKEGLRNFRKKKTKIEVVWEEE